MIRSILNASTKGMKLSGRPEALARTALSLETSVDRAVVAVDLMDIVQKHKRWSRALPRVKPYYAVKCNNDDVIVSALAELGTGFDCASKGELQQVVNLGVEPENILYANPCKATSQLTAASKMGVKRMTFDNVDELMKIKAECPDAKLLLRLLPNDEHAKCRLGEKYGADMADVPDLLRKAKEFGLTVEGFSYHVGSGCYHSDSFIDALRLSRAAFDLASDMEFTMSVLDIGGGFPGETECDVEEGRPSFEVIAKRLRQEIDTLFPDGTGVDIIAEPGRFYVSSSCTLATRIIARRLTRQKVCTTSTTGYTAVLIV